MAYFNHAFQKCFLGTGLTADNPNVNMTDGFIIEDGVHISALSNRTGAQNDIYGPGSYGFFNPQTWVSEDVASISGQNCCPLVLASASLLQNDKIGPFHGGYLESNKSKMINPRHVQRFYRVDTCIPQQAVISVGNTPATAGNGVLTTTALTTGTETYVDGTYVDIILTGGTGYGARATVVVSGGAVTTVTITRNGWGYTVSDTLTISADATGTYGNLDIDSAGTATTVDVDTLTGALSPYDFQGGTVESNCCFEFLCDETYYLRIDVKGSPALRAHNHNSYYTVDAYTGCCDGPVPTAVDSTLVMIQWATQIVETDYLKDYIAPVVYDELGNAWYAPNTTVTMDGTNTPVTPAEWWTAYVSPGHTADACAGIRLFGAYVETKFGNCSFQMTDFFEKEPVQIYASMVDYNGDPCTFEGICVYNDCLGYQGMGFGEQVVRDLIKSESYLQNFFHTDIRTREITQGDQILASVDRNALYTRYFLLHSVPRPMNPSGVYDADRYLLEIIVSEPDPANPDGNAALETFVTTWLDNCPNCVSLEVESCGQCIIEEDTVGITP